MKVDLNHGDYAAITESFVSFSSRVAKHFTPHGTMVPHLPQTTLLLPLLLLISYSASPRFDICQFYARPRAIIYQINYGGSHTTGG